MSIGSRNHASGPSGPSGPEGDRLTEVRRELAEVRRELEGVRNRVRACRAIRSITPTISRLK